MLMLDVTLEDLWKSLIDFQADRKEFTSVYSKKLGVEIVRAPICIT